MNRNQFYESLADRRARYRRAASDEEKRTILSTLIDDADNTELPDGSFWATMEWFLGSEYVEVLEELGMTKEIEVTLEEEEAGETVDAEMED